MNQTEPSAVQSALRGLCPRCGAATLFEGIATFAPRCRACGLDYWSFNVGDGPAAFLTLLVGGLITGLAIALELAVSPPMWLHILLWVPLTAGSVLFALRYAKAGLLVLEYKNRAREGRIKADE
jgi:uncharacterized protein (DUF983 family)